MTAAQSVRSIARSRGLGQLYVEMQDGVEEHIVCYKTIRESQKKM